MSLFPDVFSQYPAERNCSSSTFCFYF